MSRYNFACDTCGARFVSETAADDHWCRFAPDLPTIVEL